MELRHIRTFDAAARSLSFSAAARELHFAQSTVSEQILSLENDLGVKLFVRATRGLELTEQGSKLLGYSRTLLSLIDEAENEVAGRAASTTSLRLGALETLGIQQLPEALSEFQKSHPLVSFAVTRGANRGVLYEAVLENEIDVSLTFGPPPAHFGLQTEAVAECRLVLVVPTGHPVGTEGVVDLDRLSSERFLVTEAGCGFREMFDSALGDRKLEMAPTVVESIGVLSELVAAGMGCALLPQLAINPLVAADRVQRLEISNADYRCFVNISWLENRDASTHATIDHIRSFRRIIKSSFTERPNVPTTQMLPQSDPGSASRTR
ncbi:DNA-binding transcriptional LysR family regulator [Leifsonia sp. EB41]|uniref:LysR family transcriptional regulator n=1 Tax=Leifsonia sp. EB41 TaxID=3156260 RepID=UPI0035172433